MDSSAQVGSSTCSSPPAPGTEPVSSDCKWLGFGSTCVGAFVDMDVCRGWWIKMVYRSFLQNISNWIPVLLNLRLDCWCSGYHVTTPWSNFSLLVSSTHKGIFSCAKASSECKLWSGILSSTQGRYLIVTIKEQEVTHFPFASSHPAPAGCRWFFPSPGGPSTLTFLSQPFGWDKAKSCYLGICEITENQEMWGQFQSCQRSAMTPSRSLYLKSVPQMMKASFLSYWFVIKASHSITGLGYCSNRIFFICMIPLFQEPVCIIAIFTSVHNLDKKSFVP